jgi:hypothetical protein
MWNIKLGEGRRQKGIGNNEEGESKMGMREGIEAMIRTALIVSLRGHRKSCVGRSEILELTQGFFGTCKVRLPCTLERSPDRLKIVTSHRSAFEIVPKY